MNYHADFVINLELITPLDIENAILTNWEKSDIKWEHLGEMNDPRVNRITYEEVIDGATNTSSRPLHEEKGSGSRMGAGAS